MVRCLSRAYNRLSFLFVDLLIEEDFDGALIELADSDQLATSPTCASGGFLPARHSP